MFSQVLQAFRMSGDYMSFLGCLFRFEFTFVLRENCRGMCMGGQMVLGDIVESIILTCCVETCVFIYYLSLRLIHSVGKERLAV